MGVSDWRNKSFKIICDELVSVEIHRINCFISNSGNNRGILILYFLKCEMHRKKQLFKKSISLFVSPAQAYLYKSDHLWFLQEESTWEIRFYSNQDLVTFQRQITRRKVWKLQRRDGQEAGVNLYKRTIEKQLCSVTVYSLKTHPGSKSMLPCLVHRKHSWLVDHQMTAATHTLHL